LQVFTLDYLDSSHLDMLIKKTILV